MNDYTKKLLDGIELSYTDDGRIEVLVSPGYGAGWSTWNDDGLKLAVDKRIVDFYKEHGQKCPYSEVKEFITNIGYTGYVCVLGWDDLIILTVSKGCRFRIDEYDGFETLITYDDMDLFEL